MISGMYMGEIVRLVLCKLANQGVLFKGRGYDTIKERGSFDTSYVSQIERYVISHHQLIRYAILDIMCFYITATA